MLGNTDLIKYHNEDGCFLLMLCNVKMNLKYKINVKLQNSERENQLLKDQLNKYISAVQMIRSNNAVAAGGSLNGGDDEIMQPIPAEKESLKRDYSYEAEQCEKKLIQVAEMHGKLIEFNTYLHKMLTLKNMEIERLKLVQLRGPLTNEIQSIGSQEFELLHNSNDNTSTTIIYNYLLLTCILRTSSCVCVCYA